jgi:hypothetical protein
VADISHLHYGVRYPTGHVTDFAEDRDNAIEETRVLRAKGVNADVVSRRVGIWKRSMYQPPASNETTTTSDTASDGDAPAKTRRRGTDER